MPALWYDDECWFDSLRILRMLDRRHPTPHPLFPEGNNSDDDPTPPDWQKLNSLFAYAPAFRLAGPKLARFWYEWSIMRDDSGDGSNLLSSGPLVRT